MSKAHLIEMRERATVIGEFVNDCDNIMEQLKLYLHDDKLCTVLNKLMTTTKYRTGPTVKADSGTAYELAQEIVERSYGSGDTAGYQQRIKFILEPILMVVAHKRTIDEPLYMREMNVLAVTLHNYLMESIGNFYGLQQNSGKFHGTIQTNSGFNKHMAKNTYERECDKKKTVRDRLRRKLEERKRKREEQ